MHEESIAAKDDEINKLHLEINELKKEVDEKALKLS